MQTLHTHLWFDKEAREAAEFYVSTFGKGSGITSVSRLDDTPSGSVEMVSFELRGMKFQAISAGPYFKFNPSISLHVNCDTPDEVDEIWAKLSPGGAVLMELGAYPFSERYGWLEDKYGLSWQIIYAHGAGVKQRMKPVIMFVGDVSGRGEEAVNFWTSVIRDAKVELYPAYRQRGCVEPGRCVSLCFILAAGSGVRSYG